MILSENAESDKIYLSDKVMFFYNCSYVTYILYHVTVKLVVDVSQLKRRA